MSEEQEIAMGKKSDPAVVAQYGLYQDQTLQKFINSKGQLMAKISHRPNLSFEFKIVDSPVVNAFALPGGYIYFTRGIMAHFNNEAEFAGVLGHEIGHITARHSAKQYSKQQVAQVLMVGGMIVSPQFQQFGNEAQQGLGLLFLKYGRDNESESDRLGVEYSTKIGYDAQEMAGFFETLKRLSQESGAGEIPSFLSTHPNPSDRFENVKKLAAEWQNKSPDGSYKIERDAYLKMVDGLVYGDDPRQGFVENSVFYHPELKFKFPVPTNWRLNNSPTQVQIAPENGKALIAFTLSDQSDLASTAADIIERFKLTVKESNQIKVNGFPAISMTSEQVNQGQATVTILTYLIKSGSSIYAFHGLSNSSEFNIYQPAFISTMTNFRALKDASKLNVKPRRIRVKPIPRNMTLDQALTHFKIPQDQLKESAVLNGMELSDTVKKGTFIKIISN